MPETEQSKDRHDGLTAAFINTSLKKSNADSHTQILMDVAAGIMERAGVKVDRIHLLDHDVPPGIYPDMTEHGWSRDDWPQIWPRILAADIIVIGTPLWLGEESSVCRILIERLYAMSDLRNAVGQSIFYNKVGASVITGNEDGIKHTAMTIGFALSHLGCTIPPQADCGWIGEAGPGPSYGDKKSDANPIGYDNEFTKRNTTIMAWNTMHLAAMIRNAGGIPNHGNDRDAWDKGERFDYREPKRTIPVEDE